MKIDKFSNLWMGKERRPVNSRARIIRNRLYSMHRIARKHTMSLLAKFECYPLTLGPTAIEHLQRLFEALGGRAQIHARRDDRNQDADPRQMTVAPGLPCRHGGQPRRSAAFIRIRRGRGPALSHITGLSAGRRHAPDARSADGAERHLRHCASIDGPPRSEQAESGAPAFRLFSRVKPMR